ncbi:MAG: SH3 domain-containing protein [Beijerinckiaceae bacterium]|nr:SH3 domain-containing protein [Beijerinckiaceae bacterium]
MIRSFLEMIYSLVGFLGLFLLAVALSSPTHATAFCEVKATRDGFVALRDAPSTGGKLIRRLKAGEMVQLDSTRRNPRGWKAVIFREDGEGKVQPGWVSAGLIERECG